MFMMFSRNLQRGALSILLLACAMPSVADRSIRLDNGGIFGVTINDYDWGILVSNASDIGICASVGQEGCGGTLGSAVVGVSPDSVGVYGDSKRWLGVNGYSETGIGVEGESYSSYGVHGESFESDGMFGEARADNRSGIWAKNNNLNGWAGYFNGRVHVNGQLSKSSGGFKIDHPLQPENKYLYHSFVESPDMMNLYNGNVELDNNGEAWIELPEWFDALNRDFRYQLTCIGGYAPVYIAETISDRRFKIAGGSPDLQVSWQVSGIRQDSWAEAHRIPVEEEKSDIEQGTYLHPLEWKQPTDKDVQWVHHPDVMQRDLEGDPVDERLSKRVTHK